MTSSTGAGGAEGAVWGDPAAVAQHASCRLPPDGNGLLLGPCGTLSGWSAVRACSGSLLVELVIVGCVKALYDRPLTTTDGMVPTGGGRVAELVACPLLNALWPGLAGFVQPLSGEYAGRQKLLEQVPFVSGYGVERGLLVDLAELAGIDTPPKSTWAPTSTHHSDAALGRMAGQILQTALARRPGIAVGNDSLVQYVRTSSVSSRRPGTSVSGNGRPCAQWRPTQLAGRCGRPDRPGGREDP